MESNFQRFTFSNAFNYSGNNNLVVIVCSSGNTYQNDRSFWRGRLDYGKTAIYRSGSSSWYANYTDGAAWYGAYTSDANTNTVTLTDSESGQKVTYTVTESTPTSLAMDIANYGQANFKPVTKADFTAYVEEVSKYAEATTGTSKSSSSSSSSSK